jgi:hypothetical protein
MSTRRSITKTLEKLETQLPEAAGAVIVRAYLVTPQDLRERTERVLAQPDIGAALLKELRGLLAYDGHTPYSTESGAGTSADSKWKAGKAYAEQKMLFGTFTDVDPYATIGTLSASSSQQRQEFRIWYQIPTFLEKGRAWGTGSEEGKGLLLHVEGPAGALDSLVDAWFDPTQYRPLEAAQGMQLYIGRDFTGVQ